MFIVDLGNTEDFAVWDPNYRKITFNLDENVSVGEYQFKIILSDGYAMNEYEQIVIVYANSYIPLLIMPSHYTILREWHF